MKSTLSFILAILVLNLSLAVCKQFEDPNYDDLKSETDDILSKIEKDIQREEKNKNKNKFSHNDDISFLEDELNDLKSSTRSIQIQKDSGDAAKVKTTADSQAASSTATPSLSSSHENEASHSWTIFFILCILGKAC